MGEYRKIDFDDFLEIERNDANFIVDKSKRICYNISVESLYKNDNRDVAQLGTFSSDACGGFSEKKGVVAVAERELLRSAMRDAVTATGSVRRFTTYGN